MDFLYANEIAQNGAGEIAKTTMDIAKNQSSEIARIAIEIAKEIIEHGKEFSPRPAGYGDTIVQAASRVGAGICMGLGAIGPGLGEGFIGGKTAESIARQPELEKSLVKNLYIANAMAETTAVYAFAVAIVLIFV